ncbi:MAG: hypothetical protein AB1568_04360 [Thermodesulfobacteriota bacterium]
MTISDTLPLADLRRQTEELLRFAAPAEHRQAAMSFLHRYGEDVIGLRLLHFFYSYLPEGLDDAVVRLEILGRRQGFFLLRATTLLHGYLYLVTAEETVFLGRAEEGLGDGEILEFFGWRSPEEFSRELARAQPAEYLGLGVDPESCPVCLVRQGEIHILGCPVEICPWCGGGLTRCNCRFDRLQRTSMDRDAHLDALAALLEKKGRIPFSSATQSPVPAAAEKLLEP